MRPPCLVDLDRMQVCRALPVMEQAVRKLLVASQKGGVGKTTTSINVAATTALAGARVLLLDADPLSNISSSLHLGQHAQRQTLRQVGLDLPGVLVSNVIPGLDVLSPYEDGGCTDDDLDRLLALLATPAFQESYGCLVVDTPPFLGPNPGQLLHSCDEFILVMRSEPLAYRTLPAFLELVQRSRGSGARIKMCGILLTLPEGEVVGGRWERELRGRFGTRILTIVIPHDEAVTQAVLFGNIVSHLSKDAAAAQAYYALVESLELAQDARDTLERTSAAPALLQAFASLKEARPPARHVAATLEPLPVQKTGKGAVVFSPPCEEKPVRPLVAAEQPPLIPRNDPNGAGSQIKQRTDDTPAPGGAPAVALPPAGLRPPAPRPPTPPRKSPAAPAAQRGPVPGSANGGAFPVSMGLLWVGLAMIVGVGLRFLHLPDKVIPILIGVGVGVMVVAALRHLQKQEPGKPAAPVRKPTRRADSRPDPAKRLSGLKRRVTTPARNIRDS